MSTRLTKKQKAFADAYLETGNGTKSALQAYDTDKPNTARAIASENLTNPNVRASLEDKAEIAASIVFEIATAGDNDNVKLSAAKDILDRAGYKPIEKSMNVDIKSYRLSDGETEKLADELTRLQKENN